ncbi:MAG: sulfotransferase [bacterium]|nr:hypothetical protein [Deltaproteobacteria bacterium]MCP4905216.1 sulfotransferase [bacterium]
MLTPMSERAPRPDWVRRINVMADAVGGAEHLVSLDVEELVRLAKSITNLSDFGDFDGDWRGRLDAMVEAIEGEANLSVIGRLQTRQEILRCLQTRLFMTKKLADDPAILDEKIEAPIIVTGQARSGTSILFELLALDPDARSIAAWEATNPVPQIEDISRLMERTECEQEFWSDIQPEYAMVHENRSDLPVECITAMMPSFASFQWWIESFLPSWMPDFVAALQFHTVYLKILQYQQPKRTWVLKTPVYLPVLDLVFQFFPDAWILLTHRDPLKTLPSGMSTLASVRWQRSDTVDLERLTEGAATSYDLMVHVKQRRDAGDFPDRIADVHFVDQVRDPVAGIRAAYGKMGRSFGDVHAKRIRAYLDEKPKGKFGSHEYDPEDWGFSRAEIREKTRAYLEAYGVEREDGD